MAKGYLPVVRDQGFLLPPDMRDWLPADHQVWLVIEVVDKHLDTSAFHAGRRTGGAGRAGYDPDMLLTLLIWAYGQGVHSSRRIERLCQQDIAFRIICGGQEPDHTAIARFRAEFASAVTDLFTQVLVLCARLGMGALATITLDGTKVRANASMSANRQREWLAEQARRAGTEHAATDVREDTLWGPGDCPDVVPPDLTPTSDAHPEHDGDGDDDGDDGDDGGDDGDDGGDDGDDGDGVERGGPDSPARRRGRMDRSARIARAWAQVQAEDAARAERARAEQAKAEEYLRGAQVGTPTNGAPPASVREQAARARLAQAEATQQKKIDEWEAAVVERGGRPPRGWKPQPLDDCARVQSARARLARAEERERAARERAAREQAAREQAAREHADRAAADAATPSPATRNVTDPDSRLMPTRSGFIQAYNAQNVICRDGLILATELTQTPGDVTWLKPMMAAAQRAADLVNATHTAAARHDPCTCPPTDPDPGPDPTRGPRCRHHPGGIGILLADAGYLSRDNLTATGPDRLIAVGKHRDLLIAAATTPATGQPPPSDPIEAMTRRLRTPDGIATYNQRGHIAETPHGQIKHNLGFRQFSLRGLTKTTAEWTFVCAVANLFKALPVTGPTLILPTG